VCRVRCRRQQRIYAGRAEQNGALHLDQRNTPTIERQSQFLIAQGEAKGLGNGSEMCFHNQITPARARSVGDTISKLVPQRAKLGCAAKCSYGCVASISAAGDPRERDETIGSFSAVSHGRKSHYLAGLRRMPPKEVGRRARWGQSHVRFDEGAQENVQFRNARMRCSTETLLLRNSPGLCERSEFEAQSLLLPVSASISRIIAQPSLNFFNNSVGA
jgi:hypothetical protein